MAGTDDVPIDLAALADQMAAQIRSQESVNRRLTSQKVVSPPSSPLPSLTSPSPALSSNPVVPSRLPIVVSIMDIP